MRLAAVTKHSALVLFLTVAPLSVVASGVSGCAPAKVDSPLNYTQDAKRAYDEAFIEFQAHNWLESQLLFREVKRKYVYSRYARLAELRIADADFEQEKFTEAVRGYRAFIHDHRSDTEDVSYARSRIAEAQFQQIGDSFLLPSADDRDQAIILDAYRELRQYLLDYPEAKESKRIQKLLSEVTGRLVRHELHVARFYLKRDNYEAAVLRVQYALRTYSPIHFAGERAKSQTKNPESDLAIVSSGLEAEALLLLGEVYLQMHKWEDARDTFTTILRSYGDSPLSVQAKSYLAFLERRG